MFPPTPFFFVRSLASENVLEERRKESIIIFYKKSHAEGENRRQARKLTFRTGSCQILLPASWHPIRGRQGLVFRSPNPPRW